MPKAKSSSTRRGKASPSVKDTRSPTKATHSLVHPSPKEEKAPQVAKNTVHKNQPVKSDANKIALFQQISAFKSDEPLQNLRKAIGKRKLPEPNNPFKKRKITVLTKVKKQVVKAIKTPVSPTKQHKAKKALLHTELLKSVVQEELLKSLLKKEILERGKVLPNKVKSVNK